MQYNLRINQVFARNQRLNLQEAIIFDYLIKAQSWAAVVGCGENVLYFVSRTKIASDIPIIGESADTFYRYYRRLEAKGLVRYEKIGNMDCFRILPEVARMYFSHEKLGRSSEHSDDRPSDCSDDHPTYTSINSLYPLLESDTRTREKKEEEPPTTSPEHPPHERDFTGPEVDVQTLNANIPYTPPELEEVVNYFQIQLDDRKVSESEAEDFLNHYASNAWRVNKYNRPIVWQYKANDWIKRAKDKIRGQAKTKQHATRPKQHDLETEPLGVTDEVRAKALALLDARLAAKAEHDPRYAAYFSA